MAKWPGLAAVGLMPPGASGGVTDRIEVGGVGLSYRRWGRPGPRPAVLLHALGEEAGAWKDVGSVLALDRPVYAFDCRGHGASDHTPDYSFELLRDDVAGAVETLGLHQVSIVGHSLGGMVAYLLAAKRPAWLTRLVLEDAPAPLPVVPPRPTPRRPSADLPFDWQALVELYRQRDQPDPQWWAALDQIEVPTLAIGGGTTSHVDEDQLADMARRIPSCALTTIDAGHHIHQNRPDEFLAVVRPFLAGDDGGH